MASLKRAGRSEIESAASSRRAPIRHGDFDDETTLKSSLLASAPSLARMGLLGFQRFGDTHGRRVDARAVMAAKSTRWPTSLVLIAKLATVFEAKQANQ